MVQTAKPPDAVAAEAPEAPEGPQGPSGRRPTPALRVPAIAAGVLVVLGALLLVQLGAQERGGPAHLDLSIGDGIPATLYVPDEFDDGEFPYQKPVGERPPLVVVAHGYSADRMIMSSMARSLARAGYAALAFDFRGHGSNTGEFSGELRDDFDAVLDWAETSPLIDPERIAVLGHSMGAGAALDFASVDPRAEVVIPVSGGWTVSEAHLPANVLFLVAENDPGSIHDRQEELARDLGDRTNVEAAEIGGTDHVTILYSGRAISEIVSFLDPILGVERAAEETAGLRDPRLGTAGLYLLVALLLVAFLGLVIGRLVSPLPSSATAGGFLLIAGALLVTMPLLTTGGPGFLPLGAGQPVIIHLALAAGLLWATRLFVQRGVLVGRVATWVGSGPWLPLRSVAWPGVAAGLVIFVLLAPLGIVFHRLVPNVERLLLWGVVAALALPFFAAFEAIVRRGGIWAAIGRGALGRLVLLVALIVGVGLQVLPGVIALVTPLLIFQYLLLEVFAATCYAQGRNPAVVAVVDAVFLAWMVTTLTPIG